MLGALKSHMDMRVGWPVPTRIPEDGVGAALAGGGGSGGDAMLTMRSLPVGEHVVFSLHFSLCWFSVFRVHVLHLLLKFIPTYFTLFDAIVLDCFLNFSF